MIDLLKNSKYEMIQEFNSVIIDQLSEILADDYVSFQSYFFDELLNVQVDIEGIVKRKEKMVFMLLQLKMLTTPIQVDRLIQFLAKRK